MGFKTTALYDLWTLDAANEYTPMVLSQDFRNAIFTFTAADSAWCTVKFYQSTQEARPSLGSAVSATNVYSTVQVVDLEDGMGIQWDTWVVYAWSSDGVHTYEMNTNANTWIGCKMTARSAGSVKITVALADNQ
jgi:hypothetical protein